MTFKNCIIIAIITVLAGCRTPPKEGTAKELVPDWSNLLEQARSHMTTNNGVNPLRYALDTPIYIPGHIEPSSTQPPGTLIGFPLKRQDPRLTSRGWTELGIVLWLPPKGDIKDTHFPNQIGMMYLVKVDKDGRATEKHWAKPTFVYGDTPNMILDPIDETAPSAAPPKGQN